MHRTVYPFVAPVEGGCSWTMVFMKPFMVAILGLVLVVGLGLLVLVLVVGLCILCTNCVTGPH